MSGERRRSPDAPHRDHARSPPIAAAQPPLGTRAAPARPVPVSNRLGSSEPTRGNALRGEPAGWPFSKPAALNALESLANGLERAGWVARRVAP